MTIFNDEFLSVDPAEIVDRVRGKGYFEFPNAVRGEFLDQLQSELAAYRPAININDCTPVWLSDQYFFPQAFACSQSYYDYIVSEKMREICRVAFPEYFRLKCHRYYETSYGHSMEWHADNVTNEGVVTDTDGLIFMLYINDVFDGEFQLVENSYKERKSGEWSYNYTNRFIEAEYGDKIRTFSLPAGSLIVYDTYGIHRAKPIVTRGFTRKSIFFQVDASASNAEEILVNPALIRDFDPEISQYLGFGAPQDFKSNPVASIKHVPAGQLLKYQGQIARALTIRGLKAAGRALLTHDQRMGLARKYNIHL